MARPSPEQSRSKGEWYSEKNGTKELKWPKPDIPVFSNFNSGIPLYIFTVEVNYFISRSQTILAYKTPWPLDRKRTIPTERPPLVAKLVSNLRIEGVAWSAQRIPPAVNSIFLTGAATFSFK
jgi:hypothetical protein